MLLLAGSKFQFHHFALRDISRRSCETESTVPCALRTGKDILEVLISPAPTNSASSFTEDFDGSHVRSAIEAALQGQVGNSDPQNSFRPLPRVACLTKSAEIG